MKKVSFEVAKAIKEAGYPQGNTLGQYAIKQYYDNEQECELQEGQYSELFMILGIDAPTYLEVWLWLWREKGIRFDVEDLWDAELSYPERGCASNTNQLGGICTPEVSDPEEAIIAAIEYMTENNLIK